MNSKKILIFGVFDGIHEGHLSFISDAKKEGNHLVVIVARDSTVNELKGEPPKYNEVERIKALLDIPEVDLVLLGDLETGTYNILKEVKPDVVFIGYDQISLCEDLNKKIKKGYLNKMEIITGASHKPEEFHSSILKKKKKNYMNKTKVIFLPGNGGDGATSYGWFPYVKSELLKLGYEVISPTFPDGELARSYFWLTFLDTLGPDQNTILIGHSSGAVAAMRYAEYHKILGSVLVAPCYTDLGIESEKLSGYYNLPWDWERIKANQEWIIQFSSTDDPFIPIDEARYINNKLETEYYELTQGHFMGNTLPELVEAIKLKTKDISSKI